MATDLNRVMIIGRLTRDPELKYTKSGTPISNFSIANNKSTNTDGVKKESVSFFDCIVWNKLAELAVAYLKKGSKVAIEGRLQQNIWEDKEGAKRSKIEIVCSEIQFLDTKNNTDTKKETAPSRPINENPFGNDDEIPF